MPFKRPSSTRTSSASSSNSYLEPLSKRTRLSSLPEDPSPGSHPTVIKLFILQAKLDSPTIADLLRIAESNIVYKSLDQKDELLSNSQHIGVKFQLCHDVDEAKIIITGVHMKKRFERHIDWELAKEKAIVTPQWLFDSARQGKPMPCDDYIALKDLHDETVHNCPDPNICELCGSKGSSQGPPPSESPSRTPFESNDAKSLDVVDITKLSLSHTSRYACCRASPLVCSNQGLADELDVVRRSRSLEGEDRSALSYARAIAAIKAFPDLITAENLYEDVSKLPFLGKKILSMVEQYVENGYINESGKIRASPRFHSLLAFTEIYGIGPHTARKLYSQGMRTIDDLRDYYGQAKEGEGSQLVDEHASGSRETDTEYLKRPIRVSLTLVDDFSQNLKNVPLVIPRDEVEEINRIVMGELNTILSGCTSTIVGGYRRGKPESNDVDIVITHLDAKNGAGKVKGLCKKLVRRLYQRGFVTHVMHLSNFRAPNALRLGHWDSLEKALTVFILPPSFDGTQSRRRVHRRLDLIFAAPEVYWTAIVGWTGSMMFERDLRLWAKEQKGLKFDSSGITRRRDSKAYFPRSEREVFEVLGLKWVPPTLRNADT